MVRCECIAFMHHRIQTVDSCPLFLRGVGPHSGVQEIHREGRGVPHLGRSSHLGRVYRTEHHEPPHAGPALHPVTLGGDGAWWGGLYGPPWLPTAAFQANRASVQGARSTSTRSVAPLGFVGTVAGTQCLSVSHAHAHVCRMRTRLCACLCVPVRACQGPKGATLEGIYTGYVALPAGLLLVRYTREGAFLARPFRSLDRRVCGCERQEETARACVFRVSFCTQFSRLRAVAPADECSSPQTLTLPSAVRPIAVVWVCAHARVHVMCVGTF